MNTPTACQVATTTTEPAGTPQFHHNAVMTSQHVNQNLWTAVDRALEEWLAPADAALSETITSAANAGLPEIAVAPAQGRLLEVLARAVGATRILEIGTLAGYSAIRLGRALPAGGELVTLEIDPDRAALARRNIARAELAASVHVIVGPALESLAALRAAGAGPFDLIFIDADKEHCAAYVEDAVVLSRAGTLIVVDNIVRDGKLIDSGTGDASVEGVRAMMDLVARHPRLAAAGVQTVGAKGYDGLLLAVVTKEEPPRTRSAEPLELLLEHNAWATRKVLRTCAALTDEQWLRRFEIGPGSLHDTLTHIVGAMLRWADRIDGAPNGVRPSIEDGSRRTAEDLLPLLDRAAADLAASAARARTRGFATELNVTLGDHLCRLSLGAMLVHVTTHGAHHRAQCINMLRRLEVPGVSDQIPDVDVLEWTCGP